MLVNCLKRTSASWRYQGQVGALSLRQSSSASPPPFNPRSTFKFTEPPYPAWNLGHGLPANFAIQEGRESARKTWDMGTTPSRDAYRLLTSAIVPRPIALVSTVSTEGHPNLAPFSYFSMVSHNPPMISIAFSLSPRRPKDTRENILNTKEFTVNIISESFAEAANATAVESPADVNEWIVSGLTMEPSTTVKPSLVKESPVCMECELYSSQDISAPNSSDITTTVVLGLIKKVHVRESILDDDGTSIDPSKLRPIARLGGRAYGRLLEGFNLASVVWKSVCEDYHNLAKRQVP